MQERWPCQVSGWKLVNLFCYGSSKKSITFLKKIFISLAFIIRHIKTSRRPKMNSTILSYLAAYIHIFKIYSY